MLRQIAQMPEAERRAAAARLSPAAASPVPDALRELVAAHDALRGGREAARQAVFRPSHNLPTRSLAEQVTRVPRGSPILIAMAELICQLCFWRGGHERRADHVSLGTNLTDTFRGGGSGGRRCYCCCAGACLAFLPRFPPRRQQALRAAARQESHAGAGAAAVAATATAAAAVKSVCRIHP